MLEASDVSLLRRWIMWAAVAYHTRLKTGGLNMVLLIVWSLLALTGLLGFIIALVTSAPLWVLAAVVLAPIPAAGLWGKEQFAAGWVIAYVGVPFLAAPALLAAILSIAFNAAEASRRESLDSLKESFGPLQP